MEPTEHTPAAGAESAAAMLILTLSGGLGAGVDAA
jgi:hypothetical protein